MEKRWSSEYLSAREAKEWAQLQAAICETLVTNRITRASQLEPSLIEPTRFHLAICEVENHQPIDGLFVDTEE